MNLSMIAMITIIFSLVFYMIFLVLGVSGIAKNRKAQGLNQKANNSSKSI
tara:strand:+ start:387 stop:536 length:150 start_codon:yes stop_codon:yes gene_type:complete